MYIVMYQKFVLKVAVTYNATQLGLHLSANVNEKIIRGHYMDILLLLPSPKDFKVKGESEKDRRRPIAHTFTNWLQSFCIYANFLTREINLI